MTEEQRVEREWHLDRRVTGSLILAVLAQTVAIIWGAATLIARVDVAERSIAQLQQRETLIGAQIARTDNVLARIEERVAQQTSLLLRLERRLDGQRGE